MTTTPTTPWSNRTREANPTPGGHPVQPHPVAAPVETDEPPRAHLGPQPGKRRFTGAAVLIIAVGLLIMICTATFGKHDSSPLPPETANTANARPEDGSHTDRHSSGGLFGGLRVTFGRIAANDGSTLSVNAAGGTATVHTDSSTFVLTTSGRRVPDLRVGDTILVKGVKADDGSLTAQLIIGGSLNTLLR